MDLFPEFASADLSIIKYVVDQVAEYALTTDLH